MTLTASQLEEWVLSIIDRVRRQHPIEDARVELKTEWPDPVKAARRIAGHANASGGEGILWVIGADEKKGAVDGAKQEELTEWWPRVRSLFDGMAPTLISLAVPAGGATVVGLLFETERLPFVVRNPDGGAITFEVPWRDGTGIRSARREDLIRLLVPRLQVPEFELLSGLLTADDATGWWALRLDLYVVPAGSGRIVLPFHKCRAVMSIPDYVANHPLQVQLEPSHTGALGSSEGVVHSLTIGSTQSEAVIDGAGKLEVKAFFALTIPPKEPPLTALVKLVIQPINVATPAVIETTLTRSPDATIKQPKWSC